MEVIVPPRFEFDRSLALEEVSSSPKRPASLVCLLIVEILQLSPCWSHAEMDMRFFCYLGSDLTDGSGE